MLDKILVFIAMVALITFLGVVVAFVAEPDLIIVTTLIVALASHDFWISVFKRKNDGKLAMSTIPLESLPTGVSGKPVAPKKSRAKKPAAKKKKTARRKK
jgi:hypothetical protein